MAKEDGGRRLFPLTSLQIGDLQSYLSHLSLFLPSEGGKFYILVDNRPWLKNLVSRSTHWWQLMVTKSRLSPFANTKGRKEKTMMRELSDLQVSCSSEETKSSNFRNWFPFMDAVMLSRKRALQPVKKIRNSLIANSELHRTLYGFIVFEVAWSDVRGINYLNELQTDTSLAIEAKIMRRWEFDSLSQASRSISLWFSGTPNEQILLKEHLDATLGEVYHDAQESFPRTTEAETSDIITDDTRAGNEYPCSPSCSFSVDPDTTGNIMHGGLHTPPPPEGPYKRRKVIKSIYCDSELQVCSGEAENESVEELLQISDASDCEETLEATLYRDVLILFRFNDHDLPFKLRDIIMSKLRLLTLLEAGLPSWVIFLQSYPGFCRLYRPWMCPMARALYVLISVITVLIGFYDLYKNVPLLKATVSNLFGPLFEWIEAWEMISRIKYLGTMLFLHNCQKAIRWFLMVTRTIVSFLSYSIEPLLLPFCYFLDTFLPIWSIFVDVAEDWFSVIWMVFDSSFTVIGDIVEILVLPIWYIVVIAWNVGTSFIFPVFWVLLYAPFRLLHGFCSLVAFLCTFIYNLGGDVWVSVRSIFQFAKGVDSTVKSYEVSMWRSLWNDLFSQVFRALRTILNGLVAFFAACNRHRLSIYNHVAMFIRRLLQTNGDSRHKEISPNGDTNKCKSLTSVVPSTGEEVDSHED